MKIEQEQFVKLILAILVVISHLPFLEILHTYNYLFVSTFFFFSGYGLMKKKINNSKFNFKKSVLKIYIPYIIATLVYMGLFNLFDGSSILKAIILLYIFLPYGWYVRTQIIMYFIWFISLKFKNNIKIIVCSLLLVIMYIIIFKITGQILTSYKTVLSFIFGIIYSCYEKKIKIIINKYSIMLFLVISILLKLIVSSNEDIFTILIYNISGIFFNLCVVYMVYKFHFKSQKIYKISNISFELYLVQGISQCIFMKEYFCSKSYLDLNNSILILIFAITLDIILAIILKSITSLIFNLIYRKKMLYNENISYNSR